VESGLEPNELGGDCSKGAVFRFSAGSGNCSLFVGGPRDEIRTEEDTEAPNRFSDIGAAGPVSVGVGLEGVGGGVAKE
jgi:hypothetical protein